MNKFLILSFLLVCSLGNSQEKLSKLKPPTSPASSIINLNPTEVLNPKNYQALETALFSNFADQDGNALNLNDFAIEFSPYWFGNNSFTAEEYLQPEFFEQILRTSSISIASTKNFPIEEDLTNSVGLGYRSTFFIPSKNDQARLAQFLSIYPEKTNIKLKLNTEAFKYIGQSPSAFQTKIIPLIQQEIDNSNVLQADSKERIKKNIITRISNLNPSDKEFINNFNNILDEEIGIKSEYKDYKNYLDNRSGIYVDFAYAVSLNFPTNHFEYSYIPKQAIWITPRLSLIENFKVIGVLRYEWFNLDYYNRYFLENNVYENNFNYGLALDAELNKFSLKFELVGRASKTKVFVQKDDQGNILYFDKTDNDTQYIGTLSYNLTDQIVLSYNLGSQFEPMINSNQTLISLLSLNFGFGAPTSEQIRE